MDTVQTTSSKTSCIAAWLYARLKSIAPGKTILCMLIYFLLLSGQKSFAQGVGISEGSITPDASSILELRSTLRGFLIPRMTTAQRNLIAAPVQGLLIFNTTTNAFNYYDGSWIALLGGNTGVTSVTGTLNRISIGGTATAPIIDIDANYTGQTSITTLGTIGTGTWNGTKIGLLYGGTNTDLSGGAAIGDILFANSTSSFARLSDAVIGNALISGGAGVAPSWGKIGLTSHVTGNLPVANGGTNSGTALNNNRLMISSGGSIVESSAIGDGQIVVGKNGSTPQVVTLGGDATVSNIGSLTIANNAVTYGKMQAASNTSRLLGSSSTTTPVQEISLGSGLSLAGTTLSSTGSGGTVTTFSSGNLGPLFTTAVATPTSTPALSFTLSNAGSYSILGNNTGAAAGPTYFTPVLSSGLFQNQGTTTGVLHGNAAGNPSWGQIVNADITNATINLTTKVTGTLPVANGGTNSSTALNNNRIMISSGGSIVESVPMTDGQVIVGKTGSAPQLVTLSNDATISNTGSLTIANNAVTYGKMQAASTTSKLLGSSSAATNIQEISLGTGLSLAGTTLNSSGGTVTTFSAGDLSPLFTTTEANPTTTPALSFTLSNAGAYTILGNNTGAAAGPAYFTPVLASGLFQNQGTTTGVLHGNAAGNPSWGQIVNADITNATINLTSKVTGTLPVANGGTNSSTALSGYSIMVSTGSAIVQGAAGTTTTVLHGNPSGAPTYSVIGLTSDVTGTLPIANGGTNNGTLAVTSGGVIYTDGSGLVNVGAGSAGQVLLSNGSAPPTWSYPSLTTAEAYLANNVTLTANTYSSALVSVILATGTWLITSETTVRGTTASGAYQNVTVVLGTASNSAYTSGAATSRNSSTTPSCVTISLSKIVTLGSSTTVSTFAASDLTNSIVLMTPNINPSTAGTATSIHAIRIN